MARDLRFSPSPDLCMLDVAPRPDQEVWRDGERGRERDKQRKREKQREEREREGRGRGRGERKVFPSVLSAVHRVNPARPLLATTVLDPPVEAPDSMLPQALPLTS